MALSMCASCTLFFFFAQDVGTCASLLLCFVALIIFAELTAKPALCSKCVWGVYVNNQFPHKVKVFLCQC